MVEKKAKYDVDVSLKIKTRSSFESLFCSFCVYFPHFLVSKWLHLQRKIMTLRKSAKYCARRGSCQAFVWRFWIVAQFDERHSREGMEDSESNSEDFAGVGFKKF